MKYVLLILAACIGSSILASEPPSAERGRIALTTRAFSPAVWTIKGYENSWREWQPSPKEAPRDYPKAFADYYGLHPAPYENNGLPMGLRTAEPGADELLLGEVTSDPLAVVMRPKLVESIVIF